MTIPPSPAPLPVRSADAHKGDVGRVLLAGGSRGMAGSISLSARAALRTGSGLVTVAVPDAVLATVASFDPCLMTIGLPCDASGQVGEGAVDELQRSVDKMNAIGCGPGLRQSSAASQLVQMVAGLEIPKVLDADALNALAGIERWQEMVTSPAILTPHPGEFRRLAKLDSWDREEQKARAQAIAAESGAIIVLKGNKTFITDGSRTYTNPTGNPGMASGGTGDVLTGMATSLLGQGMEPWQAACLAVYAHGRAGDMVAVEKSEMGLIATDLIEFLPQVWKALA